MPSRTGSAKTKMPVVTRTPSWKSGSAGFFLLCTTAAFFLSTTFVLAQEDWTRNVRTTAYGLAETRVDSIIQNASESHVYGIEVDNDITGRYSSFLHPGEKLAAIKAMAEKAHEIGNRAFVYIAGLECITSNADKQRHSFFKDHPDWVQRDINGKPAVFGHGIAFWVSKGDEDAWISPFAEAWRKIYMERVRQIAATGIDGIYVDIPYWMTHYNGWENSWASFDKYTVAAFKKETGLDAKKDFRIGDFNDPGFVQWVKFRMKAITDFLQEIRLNIKSVNPDCKLIPEIFPGIDKAAVVVGADVYQISPIADVICHEYTEGSDYAAERKPLDWFNFITGMRTFAAFAGTKPTWILSYSWYNDTNVVPSEAMKSLFASEIFSGANVWDAKGYVMSSSNDMATRKSVYRWIADNEENIYGQPKRTNAKVGIYFSPTTRDMFPKDYVNSFRGMTLLLANSHIDFQIVTPRTLAHFNGKVLILDGVSCVGNKETDMIRTLIKSGAKFVVTGNSLSYDDNRVLRHDELLKELFQIPDSVKELANDNVLYHDSDYGAQYYGILKNGLDRWFDGDTTQQERIEGYLSSFNLKLSAFCDYEPEITVKAPFQIVSSITRSGGKTFVNLVDVRQLCSNCKDVQSTDSITVIFRKTLGGPDVNVTPFLGKTEIIRAKEIGDRYAVVLHKFDRLALMWIDRE